MVGHQGAGVAACAKHFPGHGGTDADTHHRLAVLEADLAHLRTDALPPFVAAIGAGVASVMAGHLVAPAVDGLPASVSSRWLTDILRGELAFEGVITTDALEMQALAGRHDLAESAVLALSAGADLLCLGGVTRPEAELDAIVAGIVAAVRDGRLAEGRLVDAATRVTSLGTRFRPAQAQSTVDPVVSEEVARRALDVAGPLPSWREPVLVLRCADRANMAVGQVPWGPRSVDPGLDQLDLTPERAAPIEAIAAAGTVVVVTRDRHRSPWMSHRLHEIRALRPDAVLLEMGTTGVGRADAPVLMRGEFTFDTGYAAMTDLLSREPRPTAVFCGNDVIALGALNAVRAAGLQVPRDVSIVGFDDIPMAAWAVIDLATVHCDLDAVARLGADLVLDRIAHPAAPVQRKLIEPDFTPRGSLGPPAR